MSGSSRARINKLLSGAKCSFYASPDQFTDLLDGYSPSESSVLRRAKHNDRVSFADIWFDLPYEVVVGAAVRLAVRQTDKLWVGRGKLALARIAIEAADRFSVTARLTENQRSLLRYAILAANGKGSPYGADNTTWYTSSQRVVMTAVDLVFNQYARSWKHNCAEEAAVLDVLVSSVALREHPVAKDEEMLLQLKDFVYEGIV